MSKQLFTDFEPVSEAAWKQKIQVDLKGADYNDTLITRTTTGIDIKPIYHADSAPILNIPSRATQTGDWYIGQPIYAGNATAANKKALDIIERGCESLIFIVPDADIDLKTLFNNLPDVGIQIHPQFLDLDFLDKLYAIKPNCYVHLDIINRLASDGNWFKNKDQDHQFLNQFLTRYDGRFANITVNTALYQSAGATVVQELAYYLSHLNEYLNHCEMVGITLSRKRNQDHPIAPKRININSSIGNNYFFELAKYRAYRVLTKALGDVYDLDLEAFITATPSLRNKSLLDYNVNLLRTTTECMSAVLGGADTVYNLPYDAFFNKENEFGDRIARNQLLILKEEAYLDKINNAADGSYYIDTLTKQLTEKALELFKNIEKAGGFVQSLFDGTIQRKIKESAQKELQALNSQEKILVGVNKYPNPTQELQSDYELYPFVKTNPRKTLIEPIVPKRLAEELEKSEMSNH